VIIGNRTDDDDVRVEGEKGRHPGEHLKAGIASDASAVEPPNQMFRNVSHGVEAVRAPGNPYVVH